MEKIKKVIFDKYLIRKSYKQKQKFSNYIEDHLKAIGYTVKKDNYRKNANNIIVGDVKNADVILTAHYDTPANALIPITTGFSNWFIFILSQLFIFFVFIALTSVIVAILSFFIKNRLLTILISYLIVIAYTLQIQWGFANKNNYNDNTSGVITLLSIMHNLNQEEREKVCFVFFDEEELGLVGSKHFKDKYNHLIKDKPLINFDCVANGSHLNFIYKKAFKNSPNFELLNTSAKKVIEKSRKKFRKGRALHNIYMSDQLHFKNSVGVVSSVRLPLFGHFITRIHSHFDTKFDDENIDLLTDTMLKYINQL